MRKTLFYIFVVIILVVVVFFIRGSEDRWICDSEKGEWVEHGVPSAPQPTKLCSRADTEELIAYMSEKLGVSFEYSDTYLLREEEVAVGERNQYAIVLIQDTPENQAILNGERPGSEGPPTITISIFQNNLDNYTARDFVERAGFSNFKLSDGTFLETVVAGEPALRYRATGLYENENVVVARPEFVYMFTAFFNFPTDIILSDFEEILKTVRFLPE